MLLVPFGFVGNRIYGGAVYLTTQLLSDFLEVIREVDKYHFYSIRY